MKMQPDYIGLGYRFLQMTVNAIDEMEKQGNKSTIWSDGSLNEEDSWENYHNSTKWSDQNIAMPTLFNFYHGVELVLKGLIIRCGTNKIKKIHRLSELLGKLSKCPVPPDQILQDFFRELLLFDPNGFFEKNNSSSDKYYLLFRYPELINENEKQLVLTNMIQSQEELGLPAFLEVRRFAAGVRKNIIEWISRVENK
jgi:hypothetical protein